MTLKQLEYFLEIARLGSVTKAAQVLNISQPPLSLQLKMLEEELGASLFTRTNRGLEITREGALLKERTEAILALLDESTHDIRLSAQNKEYTLRIGSIGSVNNRLLPAMISRFCRDYPYVSFQVREGRTDTVLRDLTDGNIELGFVREPFNISSFRSLPIRDPVLKPDEKDYFVAIAQPQFFDYYFEGGQLASLPLEELRGKPLVTHQRYRDMLLNICRKHNFNPHIICENGEIQSSLSWASAGIGIAIAPFTSAVMNKDPGLVIRKLESISLSPQVRLVWNPTVPLSSEALAFIRLEFPDADYDDTSLR